MNIAIPSIIPQMKRPYASINDTCASGNQCEKDIDLNTVLTYPKLEKREFGIQFVPPTYGYDSKTVTVPKNTVEGFLNPIGMGPMDDVSPEFMEEQARVALIRIDSRPSVVQDDPTQILLPDDRLATISNDQIVFPTYNTKETFEMPIHSSWVSSNLRRRDTMIAVVLIIALLAGIYMYNKRK